MPICKIFLSSPIKWMAQSITSALKHHVRVWKHKARLRQVNLMNAKVIPQDPMFLQQATLTKDKASDTTSMARKPEEDKGLPQPPQNVMTQLDPQKLKPFSRLWSRTPQQLLRMIRFGLDKAVWQPLCANSNLGFQSTAPTWDTSPLTSSGSSSNRTRDT